MKKVKSKFNFLDIKYNILNTFPFLEENEVEIFLSICEYKKYKNKATIFKKGTKSRNAAYIISGVTRAFILKNDEELNVSIRTEGKFMGLPEWLFTNLPTKYNYEAILVCELLIFDLDKLEDLAKEHHGIFDLYAWAFKDMITMMNYRIEGMIALTPEERYRDLLIRYPNFFKTVFNKHIANYLGITPVSLSRIIKRTRETKQLV